MNTYMNICCFYAYFLTSHPHKAIAAANGDRRAQQWHNIKIHHLPKVQGSSQRKLLWKIDRCLWFPRGSLVSWFWFHIHTSDSCNIAHIQKQQLYSTMEEFVMDLRVDPHQPHIQFLDNDALLFGFVLDILLPEVCFSHLI